MLRTIITGTGKFIPENITRNVDFNRNKFYSAKNEVIDGSSEEIAAKFEAITGIRERRYADKNMIASDIAFHAAKEAIEDAGIDPESLDQIILAHNFGDIPDKTIQTDILPALAARVKHRLEIKNPECIAYDIIFGCPGWVQGVISADAAIKSGQAKKILVIGAETLSRILDPYDRDSMIFSDGAGACILEAKESEDDQGILAHAALTHAVDEAYYLFMDKSNKPEEDSSKRYIKMHGRKVYEYALRNVPGAMKSALDKAEMDISEVKKIFIHQANEKLDHEVINRFYRLYKMKPPQDIMPMSVHELGNSSVATVPTLFDRVRKGEMPEHELNTGDVILFASVGAGMNINAVVYRI